MKILASLLLLSALAVPASAQVPRIGPDYHAPMKPVPVLKKPTGFEGRVYAATYAMYMDDGWDLETHRNFRCTATSWRRGFFGGQEGAFFLSAGHCIWQTAWSAQFFLSPEVGGEMTRVYVVNDLQHELLDVDYGVLFMPNAPKDLPLIPLGDESE